MRDKVIFEFQEMSFYCQINSVHLIPHVFILFPFYRWVHQIFGNKKSMFCLTSDKTFYISTVDFFQTLATDLYFYDSPVTVSSQCSNVTHTQGYNMYFSVLKFSLGSLISVIAVPTPSLILCFKISMPFRPAITYNLS